LKECLLLPGVAQCVLIEFQCDIFHNQFGEVFVGFFIAKYCGYCLTVDFFLNLIGAEVSAVHSSRE
jgi:hypothetical protein